MNRRQFLQTGVDKGSRSTSRASIQDAKPGEGRITGTGLSPFVATAENPWNYQKAAHLLRRAMVGAADKEIRQAVADGLDKTITTLFTPFTPALDLIKSWAGKEPWVRPSDPNNQSTLYQQWQQNLFNNRAALGKWWLNGFATSAVSLQERMVLFWHNHFVSEIDVVNFAEWMYTQNQLLRTYALGNFRDFVKVITIDPGMLIYLDGVKNFKTTRSNQINENYGRELLELFTLGVNDRNGKPNYTQQDVSEIARALSGYVVDVTRSSDGNSYGLLTSRFDSTRWDNGSKTVLGKTGNWNTDDALGIIFSEKADQVAKFICEKLYKTFVYEVPDYAVVDGMATIMLNNKFEIKPVMEQLLRSEHFFDASNIGAMQKSPLDYMVGAVRGIGLKNIPDFNPAIGNQRQTLVLMDKLTQLGQTVFNPPNVKGWPAGRTWVSTSTLPTRQQWLLDVMDAKLTYGRTKEVIFQTDLVSFAKQFPNPNNIRVLTSDIAQYLLCVPPSNKEYETLFETILDGGKDYEWNVDNAEQKPAERLKKLIKAIVQLAKFQLT